METKGKTRASVKRVAVFLAAVALVTTAFLVKIMMDQARDSGGEGIMRFLTFYGGPWLICVLLFFTIMTFTHRMFITVTSSWIIIPKPTWSGFSNEELAISFAEITDISMVTMKAGRARVKSIQIVYSDNKFIIWGNMLRNRKELRSLYETLSETLERYKQEEQSS